MAFVGAQEMFDYVAGALKKAALDITADAPYWQPIVATAHDAAYNNILGTLLVRGFTLAKITAWDRGAEFEKALCVFWAMNYGGALENFDNKFVNMFDRRRELEIVPVTSSSALQTVT